MTEHRQVSQNVLTLVANNEYWPTNAEQRSMAAELISLRAERARMTGILTAAADGIMAAAALVSHQGVDSGNTIKVQTAPENFDLTPLAHIDQIKVLNSGTWLIAQTDTIALDDKSYQKRPLAKGTRARKRFYAGNLYCVLESGETIIINNSEIVDWDVAGTVDMASRDHIEHLKFLENGVWLIALADTTVRDEKSGQACQIEKGTRAQKILCAGGIYCALENGKMIVIDEAEFVNWDEERHPAQPERA